MLIIFDIDGTLLRTEAVTVPAVKTTFAAHGLPEPDDDVICSFFGKPASEYHAWLAGLCPEEHAEAIIAETDERELSFIAGEEKLYDGARDLLESLHAAGHALAICSNGPDDYVHEFVWAHRLSHLFSLVYARGTRYDGKTAMVGEILSLLDERPFVVVGDRHDDIDAAHHHGGKAIAAKYGFAHPNELDHADAYANSVAEIRDLLIGQAPVF